MPVPLITARESTNFVRRLSRWRYRDFGCFRCKRGKGRPRRGRSDRRATEQHVLFRRGQADRCSGAPWSDVCHTALYAFELSQLNRTGTEQ